MRSTPFEVESLEQRRLLAFTLPPFHIPGTDTTLLVPLFSGSSPGPVTRQAPVNGDFSQTPDFSGWQTAGNDSVQAADFHSIPDAKITQASLSNAQQPNSGTLPASAANLESFLNLDAGDLNRRGKAAINGSAIKQNITAKAGDLITFKADFLTNELAKSRRDYALVSVTRNGKTQFFKITGVLKPTNPLDGAGLASETGYHGYAILLPKNGQYTIGFAVVNVGDSEFASDLLVDNVQLNTHPRDVLGDFGDLGDFHDFRGDGGHRDLGDNIDTEKNSVLD